jgi:F0F1-type ATP synthase assembly protein I
MRRVPTDPDPSDPQTDDPAPRQHEARRQAIAYQGAFEAVASIMIGGGMGYFADNHFDSSPFLLLVGFAFGFGAFFVRLLRLKRAMESRQESSD